MGVHGLDCFYTKYILPQIWKICRKWKGLDCLFFHCSLPSPVEKIFGGSPILYQSCPSAVVGRKARQFGWLLSAFLFFGRLGNLGVGLFTWTRGNIEELRDYLPLNALFFSWVICICLSDCLQFNFRIE